MTFQEQTVLLQAKISKAQHERDAWRQAGISERYLECYLLIMALERQLQDHLSRTVH